jgi:general secretion pathway protein G
MKKVIVRGFTLVELLIVIALLGVIATIVIAAINPIEQANRASDAGMKADASQIVSAIQRYYASHNQFPWQSTTCTGSYCTTDSDAEFGFASADDVAVGICGATGTACKTTATQGELVTAQELQTAFISKSWVGALTTSRLMVGKASGASSSVYVCWVPKANSNRQNLINSVATSNKMVSIASFTDAGVPSASTACTTTSDTDWAAGNCYECVPE